MPELKPQLVRIQGTERYQRLLAGVPSTAAMKSGAMTLQPGESVGEHKTEGKEEAILILEGKAEVYVAGELVFTAEQDSLVYIPPETNHDIKNNGGTRLRYVYIVSPVKSIAEGGS